MYEIDREIPILEAVSKDKIVYGDFLKQPIQKKYTTIIGNPPYVRTKHGNLYIDFIRKCYGLLEEGGELIFIVPSEFLKRTSSSKLLSEMLSVGTFTHIYHPNNEHLFENASIDVIVFRYYKRLDPTHKVMVNDVVKYFQNNNGMITFSSEEPTEHKDVIIGDLFDIYVGLVSGKESVFKNENLGNVNVLNKKNKVDRYIMIDTFPTNKQELNAFLLSHKQELLERRIRKFNEKNWFEWGALRNKTKMLDETKDCIYMSTMTRQDEVAFLGQVQYFGGGLIMMVPKQNINLTSCVRYFNSIKFKENFMYSNRFKIGHRQLVNSSLQLSNIE
jgi:adenine-specific DNA-methyltransferase